MAGKSTFLRSGWSLIVLMAQIGCFVPAQSAHIGVVDRIFSRVGASDNLAKGQSTFMVEMVETASILNQATPKSLVILDEIGRGTSTFDGLSIAWATLEHLVNENRCRGLFATHYHELTALEGDLQGLACYTVKIKEWEDQIIFMHQVVQGVADKSYGIHVAKLAGLPLEVVGRAQQVLERLESDQGKTISLPPMSELPLFTQAVKAQKSPVEDKLQQLDVDDLSPRQALDALYELKKSVA